MPLSTRADASLNLNLSGLSPIVEPTPSTPVKSPFAGPKSNASSLAGLTGSRVGSGSPLHDQATRLFPKRTRELQTPTGNSGNIWGPPTSGTSTPLFEIPESPTQDGFPDLVPLTETGINSPARRGRAGTLPSRISPTASATTPNFPSLTSRTSRPTPSTSPFRPGSTSALEKAFNGPATTPATSTLLSRLRAGSMPQRASLFGPSSFVTSQSPFATTWNPRARAATLTSISSADDPASPQQSGKEDLGVRTLDYLGLVETAEPLVHLGDAMNGGPSISFLDNYQTKNSNRLRSFSVNTQPRHATDTQETSQSNNPGMLSGAMTPSATAALEAEYEAIQERVRMHNRAVQDYALNANAARPRARTAGLVDTPQRSALRRLGHTAVDEHDYIDNSTLMVGQNIGDQDLSTAMYNMVLAESEFRSGMTGEAQPPTEATDDSHAQISRSLWIGSIPNSTTVSTLDAVFQSYGPIESTRVLTHKNCGFVNFENVQDAMRAKQLLNGTEIFPGGPPVRIGFAKAPSSSINSAAAQDARPVSLNGDAKISAYSIGAAQGSSNVIPTGTSHLMDLQSEILDIVREFGSHPPEAASAQQAIENAVAYGQTQRDIAPLPEQSPDRIFDAPRLRDIRKRIDNGQCDMAEIEAIAVEMLPEIAELSSDYLGNTVVQKLFEYCSEDMKEQMLIPIAPHLAEIGVHKNGTWAAQKIIDVCRTESQIRTIVEHLRPYTVALFLDQFGNYVLQCCLKFGPIYNAYIFEIMLSQLWVIAQGRFGARAMRACLESHDTTKDQQRMLAAAIAIHSVQLAMNTNGALLLTWLLDTCTFPRRRSILAPRLIPHLVQLCTHKVAYLTVLKVVNQRNEIEARDSVLRALFLNQDDNVLEQILSDQTSGATFIFKVLTSPFVDDAMRSDAVRNTSNMLVRIKAQPNQGYKRLMDEVGLSSRQAQSNTSGYGHSHVVPRPTSQVDSQQFNRYGNTTDSDFRSGLTPNQAISVEPYSGYSGSYNGNNFQPPQHQPYGQVAYSEMTPQGYLPFATSNNRGNGPFVNTGFNNYSTPPPSINYRAMQNAPVSPIPYNAHMSPMMNGSAYAQPYMQQPTNGYMNGYSQPQGMYGYGTQVQTVHAGGRGRRAKGHQY